MAKILFIQKFWYESLSVMQLSAVVKKAEHQAHLYMERGGFTKLIRFIEKFKPDLIGFSLMTGQHLWALQTAKALKTSLKQRKPLIIFGGPHPTFAPEIVEKEAVDIVCRGEGEGAIVDLMNAIEKQKDFSRIPNLWVKQGEEIIRNPLRPLVANLDSLPFPDREIFYSYSYFRESPNKMAMASRGCPFNYSFCFNEKYRELYNIEPNYIRRGSPGNVIEELKLLKSRYNATRIIKFHDDIFTLDKQWLFEFLDDYKKYIGLKFLCHIRIGLDDEETIKKLADADCRGVTFGLETGNEELRNKILQKKIVNQQIFETSRLLKRYRIKCYVNNMLFLPGHGLEDVWETVLIN